jgi:hypothetical protein
MQHHQRRAERTFYSHRTRRFNAFIIVGSLVCEAGARDGNRHPKGCRPVIQRRPMKWRSWRHVKIRRASSLEAELRRRRGRFMSRKALRSLTSNTEKSVLYSQGSHPALHRRISASFINLTLHAQPMAREDHRTARCSRPSCLFSAACSGHPSAQHQPTRAGDRSVLRHWPRIAGPPTKNALSFAKAQSGDAQLRAARLEESTCDPSLTMSRVSSACQLTLSLSLWAL